MGRSVFPGKRSVAIVQSDGCLEPVITAGEDSMLAKSLKRKITGSQMALESSGIPLETSRTTRVCRAVLTPRRAPRAPYALASG